ncbi:MAG TPA: BamA/TamA family outer membrane protein, partial [Chitinophagaceae bacterium]|nr:BamA/TamA family outer membrane protein [Chitinophagaceae bacterium]
MERKQKIAGFYKRHIILCLAIVFFQCFYSVAAHAQQTGTESNLIPMQDVGDVLRMIFKKEKDSTKAKKPSTISILPSIGYNPSFGVVLGAKLSAVKQYGKENTDLSAFGLEAIYTTRGVITAQARHNVFTDQNKWNFQGNWQLSKFLINDYGIGTGNQDYVTDGDSTFLIRFRFVRLTEKIYRKISSHWFAGGGISFDVRNNIDDERLKTFPSSPHLRYSLRNDFDSNKYSANGFFLSFQYNTREHPIRSYGGVYADFNLRFNQKWIGSTRNSIQLQYDLRKYFSLSKKNPEHVLALWHWASYTLNGTVPYLELPATGYDTYGRSGRAYTMGRFKGPEYADFEAEWRFPITKNKLLSGVAFANMQSASDDLNKKIFQYWA